MKDRQRSYCQVTLAFHDEVIIDVRQNMQTLTVIPDDNHVTINSSKLDETFPLAELLLDDK